MPTLVRVPFLPIFKEAPGLPMLALLMPLCVRLIFKPGKILMLLRNLKPIFPPFAKPVRCVFQLIEVNSENLRSSSTSLVGCPHRDIRIFFIWWLQYYLKIPSKMFTVHLLWGNLKTAIYWLIGIWRQISMKSFSEWEPLNSLHTGKAVWLLIVWWAGWHCCK